MTAEQKADLARCVRAAIGFLDWNAEKIEIEREAAMSQYDQFLEGKIIDGSNTGFKPIWFAPQMFDFQHHVTDWAIRKGKAAIYADCGLGKTLMQLVWAENVVRHTNKPVLVLSPLAVASQTVKEGHSFGIDAERSVKPKTAKVYVTNYEKLHQCDPADFAGVVCDESSILKSFNGVRKSEITYFMRQMPFRLLCTATAAPNDYIELGTSSEALGQLGYMDMLSRFFKNDQNTADSHSRMHGKAVQWRFKGHAEQAFWRWVCSWAIALRNPADVGFPDERFVLPELIEREHVVDSRTLAPGMLFAVPASNIQEEREERRRTVHERCEKAAALATHSNPVVAWCHLNDEADLLERLIPDAEQISGSTPDDRKEEIYEAFSSGQLRGLVIKPKIGAWGLNWQHCAHVVTFASHSYEQYYQAVRRCWRFGQKNPVTVDVVASEGEAGIKENLSRKSKNADRMFAALVSQMNNAVKIDRAKYQKNKLEIPSWL